MDLTFLSEADTVALKFEMAKTAMERAKVDLDEAKQAFEAMLARADEHGIPKAKLKKLTEERVQALFENGIIPRGDFTASPKPVGAKAAKPSRKTQKEKATESPPEAGEANHFEAAPTESI